MTQAPSAAVETSAGGVAAAAGGGGAAAAGGTSTCGCKVAFEVTVLVVMNGVCLFLVTDFWSGDRVDDEAEDVELHHTSCVSQFAIRNYKFRINKP